MHFWKKAERVLAYKQQSAVDAKKKEAMDKHLSFLVGQTQKYSSLLAQRLAAGEQDLPALPGPPAQRADLPAARGDIAIDSATAATQNAESTAATAPSAPLAAAEIATAEAPAAAAAQSERVRPGRAGEGNAAKMGIAALAQGPEPLTDGASGSEEDEGEDFQAETGTEEEDDEATLEEEEVLNCRQR